MLLWLGRDKRHGCHSVNNRVHPYLPAVCGSMCVLCMLLCLGAYGLEAGNRQYAHASMSNPGLLIASKLVAAKMFKAPPRQTRNGRSVVLCFFRLPRDLELSRRVCTGVVARQTHVGSAILDVRGNNGDDTYCLWLLPMYEDVGACTNWRVR